jgi:hypothetical protein
MVRKRIWVMSTEHQFEHHGESGEFVFTASGEMVPAAQAAKPGKPDKTAPAEPTKAKV